MVDVVEGVIVVMMIVESRVVVMVEGLVVVMVERIL